jgi:hypothetical protein
MKNTTLLNARKNIYSQNGEDGVIELLLEFFEIKSDSFCEFGAWDGIQLSNTYNLLKNKGWRGVYIEGDQNLYQDLIKLNEVWKDKVQTINKYIDYKGENTLDNILKNTFLEKDFALLSIDIDGMDYHVWDSFNEYRPKLVIIEVNSSFKPGNFTVPNKNKTGSCDGTSFSSMCELGLKKGYYPLIHFGNVFFGDKDFLNSKNYKINSDINSLYNWPQ